MLDRFRPPRQPGEGSAPYHWLLDEAGAHIAAEALGVERSELRWRHQAAIGIAGSTKLAHQLETNEFFSRLAEEARQSGGRLADWWGERRCLAAPDGYGKLVLPGRRPVSLLLELDRATEDHERLRQKARRYAKALPRSIFADDEPLLVFAVPTLARLDNAARTLASSRLPIHVLVWTPKHSPLAALRHAVKDSEDFTRSSADLAPLPAPDD